MFNKADIEKYFFAEKSESLLFMVSGVLAIAIAMFFLFYYKTSFAKGLAIPLILVAILHIVVGFSVYRKSDAQRSDMVYAYDMNPGQLRSEEVPRMEAVMKNFVVLRYTEIGLLLVGLSCFFLGWKEILGLFWKGFGIALSFQAALTLVLDFFAEKRGHEYLNGLKNFLKL